MAQLDFFSDEAKRTGDKVKKQAKDPTLDYNLYDLLQNYSLTGAPFPGLANISEDNLPDDLKQGLNKVRENLKLSNVAEKANVDKKEKKQQSQQPEQPEQSYVELLSQFLPEKPNYDEQKEKRMKAVGAINALGQMVQMFTDLSAQNQGALPIQRQDAYTPYALGELQRMQQEYDANKRYYDQMKLQALSQGLRMDQSERRQEAIADRYEKQQDAAMERLDRRLEFDKEKMENDKAYRDRQLEISAKNAETARKRLEQDPEDYQAKLDREKALITHRYGLMMQVDEKKEQLKWEQAYNPKTGKAVKIPPALTNEVYEYGLEQESESDSMWLLSRKGLSEEDYKMLWSKYWKDIIGFNDKGEPVLKSKAERGSEEAGDYDPLNDPGKTPEKAPGTKESEGTGSIWGEQGQRKSIWE